MCTQSHKCRKLSTCSWAEPTINYSNFSSPFTRVLRWRLRYPELRSDLGDAQAKAAAAMLESTRVRFQRALLWAELDGLLGRPLALIEEK